MEDDSPMPTGHISLKTAKYALKVTEICDKIDLDFGEAMTNPSMGDFIFFIFGNDDSLCALGCSPHGFTVEFEDDDGVNYYMLKNLPAWLRRLKKNDMRGFGNLLDDEDDN